MKISLETNIRTFIKDTATGKTLKVRPWQKNLVLDYALKTLSHDASPGFGPNSPASLLGTCLIGGGTNATSFANGAITFTQAGTTITASSGFFTAAMVGGIFKYGVGTAGAEYYITAFTSTTQVTVDTAATVGTPTVATVWMVQATTLQTFLYSSSTYQTTGTSCQTTIAGNIVTHQVTFVFGQQPGSYTVNEIGYAPFLTANKVVGRIVLGSSDVVGPTNFYVVQIQLAVTYTPNTPSAVANVGTNINTAGNAQAECFGLSRWTNAGAIDTQAMGFDTTQLDANSQDNFVWVFTANYAQNANTQDSAKGIPAAIALGSGGSWANVSLGKAQLTYNYSLGTAGQTIYGVGLGRNALVFDVLFTTPQTLPNGTFAGTVTFQLLFTRSLNN